MASFEVAGAESEKKSNVIVTDEEGQEKEENDSPIDEVRFTVPITDDPTEPALTFRTWTLGIISCVLLAFVNQFFQLRTNVLSVTAVSVQIIALPLGKLMAGTLPTRRFGFPGTNWTWSLNPGPFSKKEHVLITIFAGAGSSGVYATMIITAVKVFYQQKLDAVPAMLLVQTTQLLGYGWAGMFRKYLVDSPYMWWPSNLVQVSLFRVLHEKEEKRDGQRTRLQFFLIVFFASFGYAIVPTYIFNALSAISVVCWIWKNSVTAQQIGSG